MRSIWLRHDLQTFERRLKALSAKYLDLKNIEHTRTQTRSPQTNGICERFHNILQNEFYATAFRRKLYASLEPLQANLDDWLRQYNEQRTHTGKFCFGTTPMQTFIDSKNIAFEKQLDRTMPTVAPEANPL